MPKKIVGNKLTDIVAEAPPGPWRRNPPTALFGALFISLFLLFLLTLLTTFAVHFSSLIRSDSGSLLFAGVNALAFIIWFIVGTFVLRELGWQSPPLALIAMLLVIIAASYNITELGQTLVTYPVGVGIGVFVLLLYYFLNNRRKIVWLVLPILLILFVGFQINQRLSENSDKQTQAANSLVTIFQFPIYFTDAIPTKKYLVQHFFWDPSKQNIRFVTEDNIAINENFVADPMTYPPSRCGISVCVDLGNFGQNHHLYTDKNNPYFVEYYVMFENTLIRITSSKTNPLTKTEVISYLNQFKRVTPQQLMQTFDHNYFLSDSYYFIPKQVYNQESVDYSVIGETNF
ncbi:MAG: hypothetical protein ACR2LN_07200 [Candidatus Levyibacteriota bacterium]